MTEVCKNVQVDLLIESTENCVDQLSKEILSKVVCLNEYAVWGISTEKCKMILVYF